MKLVRKLGKLQLQKHFRDIAKNNLFMDLKLEKYQLKNAISSEERNSIRELLKQAEILLSGGKTCNASLVQCNNFFDDNKSKDCPTARKRIPLKSMKNSRPSNLRNSREALQTNGQTRGNPRKRTVRKDCESKNGFSSDVLLRRKIDSKESKKEEHRSGLVNCNSQQTLNQKAIVSINDKENVQKRFPRDKENVQKGFPREDPNKKENVIQKSRKNQKLVNENSSRTIPKSNPSRVSRSTEFEKELSIQAPKFEKELSIQAPKSARSTPRVPNIWEDSPSSPNNSPTLPLYSENQNILTKEDLEKRVKKVRKDPIPLFRKSLNHMRNVSTPRSQHFGAPKEITENRSASSRKSTMQPLTQVSVGQFYNRPSRDTSMWAKESNHHNVHTKKLRYPKFKTSSHQSSLNETFSHESTRSERKKLPSVRMTFNRRTVKNSLNKSMSDAYSVDLDSSIISRNETANRPKFLTRQKSVKLSEKLQDSKKERMKQARLRASSLNRFSAKFLTHEMANDKSLDIMKLVKARLHGHLRGYLVRKELAKRKEACIKIQCWYKCMIPQRKAFLNHRKDISRVCDLLKRQWRSNQVQKRVNKEIKMVIRCQSILRSCIHQESLRNMQMIQIQSLIIQQCFRSRTIQQSFCMQKTHIFFIQQQIRTVLSFQERKSHCYALIPIADIRNSLALPNLLSNPLRNATKQSNESEQSHKNQQTLIMDTKKQSTNDSLETNTQLSCSAAHNEKQTKKENLQDDDPLYIEWLFHPESLQTLEPTLEQTLEPTLEQHSSDHPIKTEHHSSDHCIKTEESSCTTSTLHHSATSNEPSSLVLDAQLEIERLRRLHEEQQREIEQLKRENKGVCCVVM